MILETLVGQKRYFDANKKKDIESARAFSIFQFLTRPYFREPKENLIEL